MKFERHHEILKRLSKFGSVKVSDLSNSLNAVSYTHLDVYKRQDGRVMTELRPLQARRLVLMRSQFNLLRRKSVIAYKLCFFNRNEYLLVA